MKTVLLQRPIRESEVTGALWWSTKKTKRGKHYSLAVFNGKILPFAMKKINLIYMITLIKKQTIWT